uniref:Uncharacterized protein n=1 Tax=Arundo donax TaxID=35708 RepID=A0A0A9A7J0_ARUDO
MCSAIKPSTCFLPLYLQPVNSAQVCTQGFVPLSSTINQDAELFNGLAHPARTFLITNSYSSSSCTRDSKSQGGKVKQH